MSLTKKHSILQRVSLFSTFEPFLRALPFDRLPGLSSQMKMAPLTRQAEIRSLGKGTNATRSAVLFLFFPQPDGSTSTVFIQRPRYNGTHSGQIAFPGGRCETYDSGPDQTALREAHEEIGVETHTVKLIGKLTDLYIPPSNYIVSSYLGITHQKPVFIPEPREVADILEIALVDLFRPTHCQTRELTMSGGLRIQTPCYVIDDHIIWGATAMIISEFIDLVINS